MAAYSESAEQNNLTIQSRQDSGIVLQGKTVMFNGLDVGKRLRWLLYANITSLLIGATALVLVLLK